MAKKWPEMVVTLSFISIFHFRSDYNRDIPGTGQIQPGAELLPERAGGAH